MRTLLIFLFAIPAYAEQRTWTIATNIVTAEAELVAVRGDAAYLRIGDKVESVPLARLSAADHEYLASLALAPVHPGPADDVADAAPISGAGPLIPTANGDVLPIPGEEHSLVVPAGAEFPFAAPTAQSYVGEEALPHPPVPAAAPWPQGATNRGAVTGTNSNRTPYANRPTDDEADRRFWRQPPPPNNRARDADDDDDDDDDEPRGFRARRLQRQRASAAARAR